MDLRDYIRILRNNWLSILLITLLGVAVAAGATALTKPTYTARTQIFVAVNSGETATDILQGSSFSEKRVTSYVTLATSPRVLQPVIDELGLRETIQEIGLDHYVGVAGSRLSRAQRQKVALARGILKNPDLLVINEATAGLDGASQSQIHNAILEERQGRGVVWVLHRPSIARRFDQTLVLRGDLRGDGRLRPGLV